MVGYLSGAFIRDSRSNRDGPIWLFRQLAGIEYLGADQASSKSANACFSLRLAGDRRSGKATKLRRDGDEMS